MNGTDNMVNGNVNNNPNIEMELVVLSDKELSYHSWHMDNAVRAGQMSHCVRKQVGAVIVKDDHAVSTGWNGMPSGFPNVCEIDEHTTHPLVRHAERNALERFMSRTEQSTGGIMYVTMSPCSDCAITIKTRAKLTQVYFKELYRDSSGIVYLLKNGVEVFQFCGKEIYKCKLSM